MGSRTNVQQITGWLTDTIILGKPLTPPRGVQPSDDPTYFAGGSFNFRLLFSVAWWAYYAQLLESRKSAINAAQLARPRQRLLNFFKYARLAHSGGEPFSASHGQLHWAGFGVALYLADRLGDAALCEYPLSWSRFEYAGYSVCETPPDERGLPNAWMPSGRAFKTNKQTGKREILGTNQGRDEVMHAIRTGKLAAKEKSQYDLGATCIARLPDELRAQIITWPASFPPMWRPFHARRFEDGSFYAIFDGPKWKDAVLAAGHGPTGQRWLMEDGLSAEPEYEGRTVLSIDAPGARVDGRGRVIG